MHTQCNPEQLEFSCVERRRVVVAFDGGRVCSDGGALLLKRTDEALGLLDRLAHCFADGRQAGSIEHSVRSMLAQRIFGLALGYADLNDHERLRTDTVFGVLAGKLDEPLAGKSTLNRLELFPRRGLSRYHRIRPDGEAIERLFVELFLDSYRSAPAEIVLDLDATDVPLHGEQEQRFFHGYYDHYCYLPLYVFCGRQPLMARLRPANIDGAAGALEAVEQLVGQIRARWPKTRIVLRADSGFAREAAAEARRVVAKAEQTGDKANPRFVVTSLALARSELARASAQTIRLTLLKIGAVVTASVRRVRFALSETCPHQAEFIAACRALGVAPR
jgi:hypothetical protein